jgi:hypothetical protein
MNLVLSKKEVKALTKALPALKKIVNFDSDIARRIKTRELVEMISVFTSSKKGKIWTK